MNCLHFRPKIVLLWVGVVLFLGALLGGCQGISPDGLPPMEMMPEDTMEVLEEIELPSTIEPPTMRSENEHEAAPMASSESMTATEETMSTMVSSPSMAGYHSHGEGTSTDPMGKAPVAPESTSIPTPAAQDSMSSRSNPVARSESNENVFIVEIRLFTFQTPELRIPVGATVVWRNLDDIEHTVTSGTPGAPDGRFDSGNLTLNQEFHFAFSQPGEYSYFCNRHPHMTGRVIVEAP